MHTYISWCKHAGFSTSETIMWTRLISLREQIFFQPWYTRRALHEIRAGKAIGSHGLALLNHSRYNTLCRPKTLYWIVDNGFYQPFHSQEIKIQEKFQISSCKILRNKWHHAKVLLKRFHLNGRTTGFHPQTQKLELLHNWLWEGKGYLQLLICKHKDTFFYFFFTDEVYKT